MGRVCVPIWPLRFFFLFRVIRPSHILEGIITFQKKKYCPTQSTSPLKVSDSQRSLLEEKSKSFSFSLKFSKQRFFVTFFCFFQSQWKSKTGCFNGTIRSLVYGILLFFLFLRAFARMPWVVLILLYYIIWGVKNNTHTIWWNEW